MEEYSKIVLRMCSCHYTMSGIACVILGHGPRWCAVLTAGACLGGFIARALIPLLIREYGIVGRLSGIERVGSGIGSFA